MQAELIGRERELAEITRFLDEGPAPPAALVVEGEPGIGKSTLWRRGIELAQGRGYRVLSSRPADSEAAVAYCALVDLLGTCVDEAVASLPLPQRHALEIALLLAEASGRPPAPHAIAFALFGALRAVARNRPTLIAIDDVQWLDASSAGALRFAARRLRDEPLRFLVAIRHGDRETPPPLGLDAAFGEGRVVRVSPEPLSLGAAQELLHLRLGVAFARATLRRIYETSGGNPFFALELARGLARRGGEPGETLELPGTLVELIENRLAALPAMTLRALEVAALLSDPSLELVGVAEADLAPAIGADVVSLSDGRIRFVHPLLASGVVARLDRDAKRKLHARLARITPALEERARHIALSLDAPSEEAASLIEEAARHAAQRGAPATASELFELAAARTTASSTDRASHRRFAAAEQHVLAGDLTRARQLLESLTATLASGPQRAEALVLLADIVGDLAPARALCEQALAETGPDLRLAAETHRQLAEILMVSGDVASALSRARQAAELAERCGDDVIVIQCRGVVAHFETYTGEITPGLLEGAVALEKRTPNARAHYSPAQILALRLMYADRLGEAREMLEASLQRTRAAGDEYERRNILVHLAQLELRAGRWEQAETYAIELEQLLAVLGVGREAAAFLRAAIDTHYGRVAAAQAVFDLALAHGPSGPPGVFGLLLRWMRGFLALSCGDAAEAARILEPLAAELLASGYGNPGVRPLLPDAIEALVGAGRFEAARRLLASLERGGRSLDNPWALAAAGRCTGLLAASEGDLEEALRAIERALVEHERAASPFERARTLLAHGTVLRRAKRKRAARESLERARDQFVQLGAALWAERALAELGRIGGRVRGGHELTPTERSVAELVAQGKTNREVAAELFVSVHTVEASLTDIYDKLGVRSRSQLTRLLTVKK